MLWKTKSRKSVISRHLVKEGGGREDIIILIDLELLSPYTPVTQVAKVHCQALFPEWPIIWSVSYTGV